MPIWWVWLMGVMFLMLWLTSKFYGGGYRCPFCGALSDDDHEPGCHGADRW